MCGMGMAVVGIVMAVVYPYLWWFVLWGGEERKLKAANACVDLARKIQVRGRRRVLCGAGSCGDG